MNVNIIFRKCRFLIIACIGILGSPFNVFGQRLVLNGAYMNLSGGVNSSPVFFIVDNADTSGITRLADGGHIYTEGQYNFVKWKADTSAGKYVFPFGVPDTAANFIPFTFNKASSGSAYIMASTWSTNPQNMPHPGVSNVPAVNKMEGAGDSLTTALDRFWDIRTSASVTADITFSYRGSENTTYSPTAQLKAQRWQSNACALWSSPLGTGNPGVISGVGTVGPITGQTAFTPFVLSGALAPLISNPGGAGLVANAGRDTVICSGYNTSIGGSPAASGGTAPYIYTWLPASSLNNTGLSNPLATPTTSTEYTLTVTDNYGCKSNDAVLVLVPYLSISPSAPSICIGDFIQLTASGMSVYNWSPSENLNSGYIANPIAGPTVTTTYSLSATSSGCSANKEITITVSSQPDLGLATTDYRICQGQSVHLSATGTGTFTWSPATGLSDSTAADPFASPQQSTTYTVKLSSGSCSTQKTVTVKVDRIPVIQLSNDTAICKGSSVNLNASAEAEQFQWSPSLGLDDSLSPFPVASPKITTNYTLTATNGSCTAHKSILITVKEAPTAVYSFTYPGLQVQFSTANTVSATYLWDFGDGGTSMSTSPSHTYTQAGTYKVTLSVENECGKSKYSDNITVKPTTGSCCQ